MLSAQTIQNFLAIPDNKVVAHGYSYCRHYTYDIWFRDGKIHRSECAYGQQIPVHLESTNFETGYFFNNVKRWYASGLDEKIIELFETFAKSLPITPGGNYPIEPPC